MITLDYDSPTNILSAKYSYCDDQCVFPSSSDRISCACRRDATNEDLEDCFIECEQEFGSVEIAYCKDECAWAYGYENASRYWASFGECGYPTSSKTPWRITYTYWATWAPIPFFPSLANKIVSPTMVSYFSNGTFNLTPWNVFHPWPGVNNQNCCYGIEIYIRYTDESNCNSLLTAICEFN